MRETGYPITLTLMGLGAYPASDPQFLGMLGMHGTYEANMAMHDCDVMVCIGARFDDRVTGRLDGFSPKSRKIHVDIDPSSINKNIPVDVAIVGDAERTLGAMLAAWKRRSNSISRDKVLPWWNQIADWSRVDSLRFRQGRAGIKPQTAVRRLYEATRFGTSTSPDVGQHQMWAAQHFKFEQPLRWMTSGGLGTMGYGFPAAIGVQVAHPGLLVLCISGDASWVMNAVNVDGHACTLPAICDLHLNNSYMGMVRRAGTSSTATGTLESYMDALPDFVKLAEAFKGVACVRRAWTSWTA